MEKQAENFSKAIKFINKYPELFSGAAGGLLGLAATAMQPEAAPRDYARNIGLGGAGGYGLSWALGGKTGLGIFLRTAGKKEENDFEAKGGWENRLTSVADALESAVDTLTRSEDQPTSKSHYNPY